MFLKNINIIFKTRRSKVTDYAALNVVDLLQSNIKETSVKCFDHNKGNYHLIVLFIHFDT